MTITKTADVEGTLQQIYALAAAGCDIVRCTCNEAEAAEGLAQIVPRSPVPIIADIHHQYRMALAALEAGVQGLRLNPGNIRKPEHIKAVAGEARDRQVPIRIGVNGGSLDPALYDKYGGVTPEAMVESAQQEMAYFDEVDFDLIKISVKASSVPLMVEAYRQLSEVTDHPLHLGRHRGRARRRPAWSRRTAGIATLLLEGIGDTIRYSLTADPVEEARAGRQLLEALGLRERKNVDLIACPSCGRAEIDVIDVAKRAMEAFGEREIPLQVAVMGCVVNGPGEAREADLGIAAGNKRGHLFVQGPQRRRRAGGRDGLGARRVGRVHRRARRRRGDRPRRHERSPSARRPRDRKRAARDAGRRRQPRHREDRRDPQDRPQLTALPGGFAASEGLRRRPLRQPSDGVVATYAVTPARRRSDAGGQVAGRGRRRDDELVAAGVVAAPGPSRRSRRIDVPVERRGTRLGRRCTGSVERRRVEHGEEVVDVDRLGGQPAAHDVVAGAHQLDAGAVEVGVEVAGAERDRLAGRQLRRG